MRFFSIFAATLLAIAPSVMAEEAAGSCLPKCYVYSAQAEKHCPASHPAVIRKEVGCFQCCKN